MSTILNSLKKSSDERNENSKSSIDNFNFGSAKNSRRSQSFVMMLLLVGLTVVIGYFGYQYLYREDGANLQVPSKASDKTVNSNTINEGLDNTTVNLDKSNKEKIPKPDSDEVKQQIQEIKNRKKGDIQSNQSTADILAQKILSETKTDETNQVADANIDNDQSETDEVKKVDTQNQPVITLTKPGVLKDQTAITPVKKQKFLYVYQLPFSIRKDIPEIKLNIHVYDKDPAHRIAIINGVKLSVGDLIENEVLLKDIIQEGIVLDFNDNEFMIPK